MTTDTIAKGLKNAYISQKTKDEIIPRTDAFMIILVSSPFMPL